MGAASTCAGGVTGAGGFLGRREHVDAGRAVFNEAAMPPGGLPVAQSALPVLGIVFRLVINVS